MEGCVLIDINTCFGFYPWRRLDASVSKLLSHIKDNGIAKALTYSMRGVFYDFREGNLETLKVCSHTDNLIPVATIDPRKATYYAGEVKAIASLGFKAVRIFPDQQGWSVEQIPFQKILKEMEYYRLPLITSELPSKLYGLTENITIPVVFISTHYYRLYDTLAVFMDRPNFFSETRQLNSPDAIELFVEKIGSDRLLFGSNQPLEYAGSSIKRLVSADLCDADKNKIFYENAERIFAYSEVGDESNDK